MPAQQGFAACHDIAREVHERLIVDFEAPRGYRFPKIKLKRGKKPVPQRDPEVTADRVRAALKVGPKTLAQLSARAKLPLPAETIHAYLTTNIHYVLDEECIEGMKGFFRMAAECGVLPEYDFELERVS